MGTLILLILRNPNPPNPNSFLCDSLNIYIHGNPNPPNPNPPNPNSFLCDSLNIFMGTLILQTLIIPPNP